MEHVEWSEHPVLKEAVLLAAFTGWNDAGDAATEAVGYLTRRYECQRVATIDPEYFYDFASVRPSVRLEGDDRRIDWPVNEVRVGALDDGRPLVTIVGIEPRLRWRTFSDALLSVALKYNLAISPVPQATSISLLLWEGFIIWIKSFFQIL